MPYIEIKTGHKTGSTVARKIVAKGTVSAVLTTGVITNPAKKLFEQYDIAYAENVPETEFMELVDNEEG
ncbi:hypothetical protein Cylst_5852 [Cylindrospermum stagnale PCC 7417]|uniref:Restriction endonuclease type IV Mrr domain-containing protein n=1 Tax=Cylindrospermum stagnale PCC 7417 TaxID=56107 RepID=K9X6Y2_9NOST|nr:hypothetical protein [Cylindrospermum stagnale]AFZ27836.1 hypothetical protein Cylst_5852 [Cylindrospermum stagnale PCC 7417]